MADEEARARSVLSEMQLRLAQGAHIALGLSISASAEDVRSAFLTLTKQFHPARFGRLSTQTQRLSNEVFLGIKAAHETLVRHAGGTVRGGGRTNQSGGMPVIIPDRDPTRPIGSRTVGTQQPVISRTLTPTKHGVPPGGAQPFGSPRPSNSGPATAPIPVTPLRAPATRPGTPPTTSRASTPNLTPPAPAPDPVTHRGTGEWQPLQKTAPVFDERAELQAVMTALAAKNWSQAKTLLNSLAARVPASKQYRALLAYTRGREAQTAGRGEDAVMEFQRALQFDPDLQQAKSAMAELLRRR